MSLSPFSFAILFLVPVLLGVAIVRAIGFRFHEDRAGFASWTYVSGNLALAGILYVWSWVARDYPLAPIAGCALVLAGALWFLDKTGRSGCRTGDPAPEDHDHRGTSRAESLLLWVLVVLLTLVVFLRATRTSLQPVIRGDEANIYALKAKILYHCGGFGELYRRTTHELGAVHQFDHPDLNPLLQLWTYVVAGSIVHVEGRFLILLYGVAYVFAGASALRRQARPLVAVVLLPILLNVQPSQALQRTASADMILAVSLLLCADCWLRWRDSGEDRWCRLGMIAMASFLWAKGEGMFYLVALCTPLLLQYLLAKGRGIGRGRSALRTWIVLPVLVVSVCWFENRYFGFQHELVAGKEPSPSIIGCEADHSLPGPPTSALTTLLAHWPQRLPQVLRSLTEIALTPSVGGWLFAAFLVLLLLHPRRFTRGRFLIPTSALLLIGLGYLAVYLASPFEHGWHLRTSAARVTFQPLGLAALWLALAWKTLRASDDPRTSSVALEERSTNCQ